MGESADVCSTTTQETTGWMCALRVLRYGLGGLAAVAGALVALSGVYMAMFYMPDPVNAASSITFIEKNIAAGRLARDIHCWGALLVVLLLFAHVVGNIFLGNYRLKKSWYSGVALLVLTLLFCVTGFLLPWSFKSYWITKVVSNWREELPLFSGLVDAFFYVGAPNGFVPVGRWYVVHIFVLPALSAVALALHTRLTNIFRLPRQRVVACLLVVLILCLAQFGVIRQDMADPVTTSPFPQPEWLRLMFFQITRYCQEQEIIGVFWMPVGLLTALCILPLLAGVMGKRLAPVCGALALTVFVALAVVTSRTGSTTPLDSCAACHKGSFGAAFATPPAKISEFSKRYDNKWLALHQRYPQYNWMMDAAVPAW